MCVSVHDLNCSYILSNKNYILRNPNIIYAYYISLQFVCMALCLLDLVRSEDDGSYRPDLYGNKFGAFNRAYDGRYNYRYNNYFNRNNAYYPNAYQPLYQQLAPPVVAFRENRYLHIFYFNIIVFLKESS